MGKYATMASELDSKVGMKVMGTAGILDVSHEGGLDIRGKMSN